MGYGAGGINGTNSVAPMGHATRGKQRPDREQFAERLFSRLDTTGQGVVTKADLLSASSQPKPVEKATANIDALFARLDADNNGELSLQEFTDGLKSAAASTAATPGDADSASANQAMNGMGGARQIMNLMHAYGLNAKPAPTIELLA